jgi:hypothetical protein
MTTGAAMGHEIHRARNDIVWIWAPNFFKLEVIFMEGEV